MHVFEVPELLPKPNSTVSGSTGATASPRVLIVDDTESNTLLAKAILRKFGATDLDSAENGLVALERVKNNHYDLIYMDCMMPEMDGYEATRAIRGGQAGEQNVHLPIIALTANAMVGDREACLEAGMSDYISKPINPFVLGESLKHWAGRRHG